MPTLFQKKNRRIAERKTQQKAKRTLPWKALGVGFFLWLSAIALLVNHGALPQIELVEGQKAPSTLIASTAFRCENLNETSLKRNQAALEAAPVFKQQSKVIDRSLKSLNNFLDTLHETAASTSAEDQDTPPRKEWVLQHELTKDQINAYIPKNKLEAFRDEITSAMEAMATDGILSDENRAALFPDQSDALIEIVYDDSGNRDIISLKKLRSPQQAAQTIAQRIKGKFDYAFVLKLSQNFIEANVLFDDTLTAQNREQAMETVKPVIQTYPASSILIRAGDAVTPQTLLLIQQHESQLLADQEVGERRLADVGHSILLLAALVASIIMLRLLAPEVLRAPDRCLLLALLSLFTLGSARLLTMVSLQTMLIPASSLIYLVPHAFAVLMAAILLGSSVAIPLGFWCSFATAVFFEQSFSVFVLGIFSTITVTLTARNVHQRSSLFKAGLWIAGVHILFAGIIAIFNQPTLPVLGGQLFSSLLSAAFSIVLTLLTIPFFEKLFRITTDITLLELSDMGHPLLQKLALQAPGTYHHSLMVATLSQSAAEAIGANPLLVRVCAYYHDIGKMAKPEFFAENITEQNNPHDDLSPHMSALVIISHVKEGLALARRHKLPQPILDAIEQHHGNGLIHYFYQKAKNQLEEQGSSDTINEADFRYGGAPAVSPEMVILSLTDAVEAASRSMEKPTPQKITNLVNDIFSIKLRDGQLDHAALTMAQINAIKESIIFSLSNMLHGRVAYTPDEDTVTQPTDEASSESQSPA